MSHSLEQNEPDQKTILLAEDFEDNAVLMKRLLEMEGYRVLIVGNGREAVEKTLEVKPDLIILDVSMPVMTGLEACTILKRNEKTRDIPIFSFQRMMKKRLRMRLCLWAQFATLLSPSIWKKYSSSFLIRSELLTLKGCTTIK